jgi:hypothetical protein
MRSHFRLRLESLEARETPAVAAVEIAAAGAFGLFPRVVGLNSDLSVRFTSTNVPTGYTDVRVATGDVTGDGTEDVVAASGPGGVPLIAVYDGRTGAMVNSFIAIDPRLTLGLNVATADVDGDGRVEVLIGTAIGTSFVAALDGQTGQVKRSFFAFPGFAGGVTVAGGDVDGDGRDDIIVGTASATTVVAVYSGTTGTTGQPIRAFLALGSAPVGVNVGFANGDILAGAASGPPVVATYAPSGQIRLLFLAVPPGPVGGVRVADAGTGSRILTSVGPSLITFDQFTGAQVRSALLFFPLTTPVFVG